ncbi:Effector protein hopD2 [Candidatus Rubidus massiliensis]|nr:Effector protein hopD2 [Candidatus Rubidus massiliensis]
MKLIITLAYILFMTTIFTSCSSTKSYPILNMENNVELPKNFRIAKNFSPSHSSSIGLEQLNASASGQFSSQSLALIIEKIGHSPLYILDLREETHLFIDGTAISWYADRDWANVGKTKEQIDELEHKTIRELSLKSSIELLDDLNPLNRTFTNVLSEKEVVQLAGLGYKKIPVSDHCRPYDHQVEEFLEFIREIEKQGAWIHIHCAAGRGRSSTFLVMYDILKNAKQVSLNDIFLRQKEMGGVDFLAEPDHTKWKYPYLKERIAFLEQFYEFCKNSPDPLRGNWSRWAMTNLAPPLAR